MFFYAAKFAASVLLETVLILVLVEYVLLLAKKLPYIKAKTSLNPCFSGICSFMTLSNIM